MRLINAPAGDEQIEIKATPENATMIPTTVTSHREVQAGLIKSTVTASPIVLTTMPYPASGPGGPSLTSRKH